MLLQDAFDIIEKYIQYGDMVPGKAATAMKEEEKLLDYLRGGSLRGWEIFGAHPELNGTSFAVYAPAAAAVSLICSAHNWQPLPMERDQYGVWRLYLEGNLEGAMYKYRVTTAAGETMTGWTPMLFVVSGVQSPPLLSPDWKATSGGMRHGCPGAAAVMIVP